MSAESDRKYRNEEWLREQYIEREKTTVKIADMCDCSAKTICRWLKKSDIQTRSPGLQPREHIQVNEEWLREKYIEEQKSFEKIADVLDCSIHVVRDEIDKYNIPTRSHTFSPDHVNNDYRDKEWLREKYIIQELSMNEIADICDGSRETIRRWLRKHNIEVRPAHPREGKHHPKWNGGSFSYGSGWSETKRERVRELDNHQCVDCDMTQEDHQSEHGCKLHVHHLIKARDIDDAEERNAVDNLVTLCMSCHKRWEQVSKAGIKPDIDRLD
jgi:transposase